MGGGGDMLWLEPPHRGVEQESEQVGQRKLDALVRIVQEVQFS